MYAAGMYLPSVVSRFTTAAGMFLVMFDFVGDWLSTGTVSSYLSWSVFARLYYISVAKHYK